MSFSPSEELALLKLLDQEEIKRLINAYPARSDVADLDGVGELFAGANIRMRIRNEDDDAQLSGDAKAVADFFKAASRVYEDGGWNTRHHVCQAEIDVSDDRETAEATTYYLTTQYIPDEFPVQPIVVGQWEDKFARVDGGWKFTDRYFIRHQVGDMTFHTQAEMPASEV
jgi:hypothetical protein